MEDEDADGEYDEAMLTLTRNLVPRHQSGLIDILQLMVPKMVDERGEVDVDADL